MENFEEVCRTCCIGREQGRGLLLVASLQGDVHGRHGRGWDGTRSQLAVVEDRGEPCHVRKTFEEHHRGEL